jgi:hypothetical protein
VGDLSEDSCLAIRSEHLVEYREHQSSQGLVEIRRLQRIGIGRGSGVERLILVVLQQLVIPVRTERVAGLARCLLAELSIDQFLALFQCLFAICKSECTAWQLATDRVSSPR